MKNLFRFLLPRKPSPPLSRALNTPSLQQADHEAANRQQLVLLTMRDLLRRSGVPSEWLECKTLLVTSRSRGPGLYLHLVVRQWDERLLRFSQAFQTELKRRLVRFDPKAAQWVHGIAWDFELAQNCPWPILPDKTSWTTANTAPLERAGSPATAADIAAESAATSVSSLPSLLPAALPAAAALAPELEKIFAGRDHQLGAAHTGKTPGAPVFAATEPAPLQRR